MQKKGIGCDFTLVSSEVQNWHVTLHSFVLQEFSTFLLPKGHGFKQISQRKTFDLRSLNMIERSDAAGPR